MITLCILFNHAFPKNIPILRELLGSRFSDVIFVHMAKPGSEPDVLTSYRGSFTFEGLVADISAPLLDRKSDYYVFMHDDVLLNPRINEHNIIDILKLGPRSAFNLQLRVVHGTMNGPGNRGWNWIVGVLWKLMVPTKHLAGSGVENLARDFAALAKTREELGRRYNFHFENIFYDVNSPLPHAYGFADDESNEALTKLIFKDIFDHSVEPPCLETPIPLFYGLADFFVVEGSIMRDVAHGLGLMAAADIFAEVAVPTVLAHVADQVLQLEDVGMTADWGFHRTRLSTQSLVEGFRSNALAYHPVKASLDLDVIQEVTSAFAS